MTRRGGCERNVLGGNPKADINVDRGMIAITVIYKEKGLQKDGVMNCLPCKDYLKDIVGKMELGDS